MKHSFKTNSRVNDYIHFNHIELYVQKLFEGIAVKQNLHLSQAVRNLTAFEELYTPTWKESG